MYVFKLVSNLINAYNHDKRVLTVSMKMFRIIHVVYKSIYFIKIFCDKFLTTALCMNLEC